jgi:hypothetical protein
MLKTVKSVIRHLGGNREVEALTESLPQAVSNWRRTNTIPGWFYLEMTEALRAKRKPKADPALWGQRSYRKRRQKHRKNGRAR